MPAVPDEFELNAPETTAAVRTTPPTTTAVDRPAMPTAAADAPAAPAPATPALVVAVAPAAPALPPVEPAAAAEPGSVWANAFVVNKAASKLAIANELLKTNFIFKNFLLGCC